MSTTIQQTLRKARQVDQKFKLFMAGKQQRDKSMEQTMKKIKQTQQTISKTKSTINSIDSLYDSLQQKFSQAINSAIKSVQKSVMLNVADPNWVPNKINEKQFVQQIKQSKQIIFLTGAGMSVASGINTFRGAKGFWDKQKLQGEMYQKVSTPEQILTMKHFRQNEFLTWKWLIDFYDIKLKAKPNKGHVALDAIMKQIIYAGKKTTLVTQNIDNFHIQVSQKQRQKKQNENVSKSNNKSKKQQGQYKIKQYKIHQIHGNINKLRCDNCSQLKKQVQFYEFKNYIKQIQNKQCPKCAKCDNKLRPHIMMFDEFYNQLYNQVSTVQQFYKQSDLLVVIGTSLQTGLSRQIVQNALQRKVPIIQINLQCEIKRPNTMWIEGKADQILDKIKYQLWKTGL